MEKGGKGIAAMLAGKIAKGGGEGPEQEMSFDREHKESCARDMMAALRSDDVAMFMAALDDYLAYGGDED